MIRYMGGRLMLIPASTWYWEGGADPATWTLHRDLPTGLRGSIHMARTAIESVVLHRPGDRPTARPYHGLGPTAWAADTARLSANAERSLADEAGGPVAQLLPVPQDGGDGGKDADPLAGLKSDIADRRRAPRSWSKRRLGAGAGAGRIRTNKSDWKSSPPWSHATSRNGQAWPNPPLGRVAGGLWGKPSVVRRLADGTSKAGGISDSGTLGVVRPFGRLLVRGTDRKNGIVCRT